MSLRSFSKLGFVFAAVVATYNSFPMDAFQGRGLLFLLGLLLSLGVLFAVPLRREVAFVARRPDVWVPLGCWYFATNALTVLGSLPFLAFFAATKHVSALGLSLTVSLMFIVQIVLGVAYLAWQTHTIREACAGRESGPSVTLQAAKGAMVRVFGASAICVSILLIAVALVLFVLGGIGVFAFVFIGVVGLAVNFSSSALLLRIVDVRRPFGEALSEGIRDSWKFAPRWWLLLLVQHFLTGIATYVTVSYRTGSHFQSKTSWSFDAVWLGGYNGEFKWYSKLMAAYEAAPWPLVTFTAGLGLTVLAIVMKVRFAHDLRDADHDEDPASHDESEITVDDRVTSDGDSTKEPHGQDPRHSAGDDRAV